MSQGPLPGGTRGAKAPFPALFIIHLAGPILAHEFLTFSKQHVQILIAFD